jgi:D-psicose/D-tagatose/L-ribulose 3-epimerase
MIRFGMHSSLWTPDWTPEAAEKLVPEAKAYGLELIEISILEPQKIDTDHSRKLLKEHGMAASASLCLPMDALAPRDPAAAEKFLMPAVETAHQLGCAFLGGVTYSCLGWRSGAPPKEEEYANIAKALKPVARRASEVGITIGLEPCNRYETHLLNTAAQTLRMMERIGEPNLTIHLDTYHMNIEEKGIADGIRTAGKSTNYIHVSESHRGVPGTGTIDWNGAFAALKETGFSGDLVMESFVTLPPLLAAALSVWRPVARDRFEVLDQGIPFLKGVARKHGLIA